MTREAPLYLQNETYSARRDRLSIEVNRHEGVLGITQLRVTERGAGADLSVDVSPGSAIIDGDDEPNQGSYVVRLTATENVPVAPVPGSGSRFDLVVAEVEDVTARGSGSDEWVLRTVTGTASGSPSPPALPPSAILLATIGPISSSTLSITNSLIDEERRVSGRRAPAGTMEVYTGSEAPSGWLWADGSTPLRSEFPDLAAEYEAQGWPYGNGDGVNTFGLPDMQGRGPVPAGGAVSGSPGATGGAPTHTLTVAQMPTHTHVQDSHTHTQQAHTHTQNAHNHTQNSHNHTQNAHTHTQNAHNHTQNTHNHPHTLNNATNVVRQAGTGTAFLLNGAQGLNVFGPYNTFTVSVIVVNNTATNNPATAVNNNTTATNNSTTATNNAATATNNSATAVNNNTTATNQDTGGGQAHNNMPPYLVVPGWIVATG